MQDTRYKIQDAGRDAALDPESWILHRAAGIRHLVAGIYFVWQSSLHCDIII